MAIVYIHMKPHNKEIYYVGIGKDIKRASEIRGRNDRWQKTYKKYGRIIDVIAKDVSLEQAQELEMFLISSIGRLDKKEGTLVNMTDGGEGFFGGTHSEDTKKMLSELHKGNTYRKDSKASEETKRRIGEKSKGRKWSQESKDKLSKSITGRKMPKEAVRKTSEAHRLNGHKPNKEALDNATKSKRDKGVYLKEITTGVECYAWDVENYFNVTKRVAFKNSLHNRYTKCGLNFTRILLPEQLSTTL